MDFDLDKLESQAIDLLNDSCNSLGIQSGPDEQNSHRLDARDSIIAGIAGLLIGDEQVIEGLGNSIQTLAKYQHPRGMIPSGVQSDGSNPKISYGTLGGPVDVNTWFIIGSCLYMTHNPGGTLVQDLQPKIQKVFNLLESWEFNADGLLYTPLSGNWADEYPIEGYTLYDNLLRLWALQLYNKLFEDAERRQQAQTLKEKIAVNFWPHSSHADSSEVYHRRAFNEVAENESDHFACAVNPQGYNLYFDTAGHGLAMLLGLVSDQQFENIMGYLDDVFRQVSTPLLPAFWPSISSEDPKWHALKNQYRHDFENYPGNYQNGGIWPVWMGLFALGISITEKSDLPENMLTAWMKSEKIDDISFSEYISSNTLKPDGKSRHCLSAAGLLFLISAIRKDSVKKLHLE